MMMIMIMTMMVMMMMMIMLMMMMMMMVMMMRIMRQGTITVDTNAQRFEQMKRKCAPILAVCLPVVLLLLATSAV